MNSQTSVIDAEVMGFTSGTGTMSVPTAAPCGALLRGVQEVGAVSEKRWTLWVPGHPRPGGSKTAFRTPKGRKVVKEAGKHTPAWRSQVADLAAGAWEGPPVRDRPLSLSLEFVLPRPKKHFRTGQKAHLLRDDAPTFHCSKPDLTKLVRAVEDSLTGIVWHDDAQVVVQSAMKRYGDAPGVRIIVDEMGRAST